MQERATCKQGAEDLPDGVHKARRSFEADRIRARQRVVGHKPLAPVQKACRVEFRVYVGVGIVVLG